LLFHPANDVKPFAFIRYHYDLRARINAEIRETGVSNVMEKILKLGMNSLYGKTAQSVGGKPSSPDDPIGEPPGTACPWYAAAIAAGSRAELVLAALGAPHDVIWFATDGLMSKRPLTKLDITTNKKLGAWEETAVRDLVIYMSGGYTYILMKLDKATGKYVDDVPVTKRRGFSQFNKAKDAPAE
jgi:hypothetical protein